MSSDFQMFTYIILGSVSLIAGCFVVLAYCKIKGLRRPPGMLILWQCFAQTIIDLHFVFAALYHFLQHQIPPNSICQILGLITVYFFFCSWNYNVCLSFQVLWQIKHPMNNSYKKRGPIYHIFSHLVSTICVISLAVSEASGGSVIGTCFIKKETWGVNLMLIPFIFHFPFNIFSVAASCGVIYRTRSKLLRQFLTRHSIFQIVYTIFWIPVAVEILIREEEQPDIFALQQIAVVLGSASGLAISCVRLSDSAFKKYIRKRLGLSSSLKSTFTSLLSASGVSLAQHSYRTQSFYQSDYTNVFTHILNECVLYSIVTLNMMFSRDEQEYYEQDLEPPWKQGIGSSDYYTQFFASDFSSEDLTEQFYSPQVQKYCEKQLVNKYSCQIVEWAPHVFHHIRDMHGISQEELSRSFSLAENLPFLVKNSGNKGGRSPSFFYFSYDRKYLIKTISKEQESFLVKSLLKDYHKHLFYNRKSLLARIIGLYKFTFDNNLKCRLILLENIFDDIPIQATFDLKGSRVARQTIDFSRYKTTEDLDRTSIYKDLDFLHAQKYIFLQYQEYLEIQRIVSSDVSLLSKHNIMDYSLLLGITENKEVVSKHFYQGAGVEVGKGYIIGIIDYLQTFNRIKKIESFSKGIVRGPRQRKEISVINSHDYAQRFMKFVNSIIKY